MKIKAPRPWTAQDLEELRLQIRDPANNKRVFDVLHRSRTMVSRMLKHLPNDPNTQDAWRDLARLEGMMREEGLLPPVEAPTVRQEYH